MDRRNILRWRGPHRCGLLFAAVGILLILPRCGFAALPACGVTGDPYLDESLPEVQFTAKVQETTASLGNDPVRIYEFVRNEFRYDAYYGSMKSVDATLSSRGGNDYDLASLLVALLRASCTQARFVRGRIRVTGPDAAAWTGTNGPAEARRYWSRTEPYVGETSWQVGPRSGPIELDEDPTHNGTTSTGATVVRHGAYLATYEGGVPLSPPDVLKMHLWVEAKVPLGRYRGNTVDSRNDGWAWVSLDPSFKRIRTRAGILLFPQAPAVAPLLEFDYPAYYASVKSESPLEIFEKNIQDFLAGYAPGKTINDVSQFDGIEEVWAGVLPTSLPYRIKPSSQETSPNLKDLHIDEVGNFFEYRYKWIVYLCTPGNTNQVGINIQNGIDCANAWLAGSGGQVPNQTGKISFADSSVFGAYLPEAVLSAGGDTAQADAGWVTISFTPDSATALKLSATGFDSCDNPGYVSPLYYIPPGERYQVYAQIWQDENILGKSTKLLGVCDQLVASVVVFPPLLVTTGRAAVSSHQIIAGGMYSVIRDVDGVGTDRIDDLVDQFLTYSHETFPVADDGSGPFVDANHNGVKDPAENYLGSDEQARVALTGTLLHLAGQRFVQLTRDATREIHKLHNALQITFPGTGLTGAGRSIGYLLDAPLGIRPDGLYIDQFGQRQVFDRDGDQIVLQDPALGGPDNDILVFDSHVSSYSEHRIWEELVGSETISTVRGFQIASELGEAILTLTDADKPDTMLDDYRCSNEIMVNQHDDGVCEKPRTSCGYYYTTWEWRYSCDGAMGCGLWLVPVDHCMFSVRTCKKWNPPPSDVPHTYSYNSGDPIPVLLPDEYYISGGTCSDLDIQTYCTIKTRFGSDEDVWKAPAWDGSCNVIGTGYLELRIPAKSRFQFLDWDGYIFYQAHKKSATEMSWGMIIAPIGSGWLAGGKMLDPPEILFPSAGTTNFSNNSSKYLSPQENSVSNQKASSEATQNPLDAAALALIAGSSSDIILGNDTSAKQFVKLPGGSVLTSQTTQYDLNPETVATNSEQSRTLIGGDPVSLLNGHFFHVTTDINNPSRGDLSLKLVRSYSSMLEYAGPMGYGWTHTYDQHLRFLDANAADPNDNKIIWVSEEGIETVFYEYDPGSGTKQFITSKWNDQKMQQLSDDSYLISFPSGAEMHFYAVKSDGDGLAHIDWIESRNGNRLQTKYACETDATLDCVLDLGDLVRVTDPAGRYLAFTKQPSGAGYVLAVTDSAGNRWEYTVDLNGDLVSYKDAAQVKLGALGHAETYEYYSELTTAPRLKHNIKVLRLAEPRVDPTDPSGPKKHWEMHFEYWENDMVRRHTNAAGDTTNFFYDFRKHRTVVTYQDGSEDTWIYDNNGKGTQHKDRNGELWRYEYDIQTCDLLKAIDPFGFQTVYANYDGFGNPGTITDREGFTEQWTYNDRGQPLTHKDRRGASKTFWTYDSRGNVVAQSVKISGVTHPVSRTQYDVYGNRTLQTTYQEFDAGSPGETRFEYDSGGVGLVRAVDPVGNITRFSLNSLARPTRVERERTVSRDSGAKKETVVTTVSYDALGRVSSATDPEGVMRVPVYDANGNVVEKRSIIPAIGGGASRVVIDEQNTFDIRENRIATTNALGETTQFEYDSNGNVIRTTTPLGYVTTSEYDFKGSLLRQIDPSGAVWRWEYDAAGRVVKALDPTGQGARSVYDREGRVLEKWQILRDGTEKLLSRVSYNPVGQPKQVVTLGGNDSASSIDIATVIAYDALGRKQSVSGPYQPLAGGSVAAFPNDPPGTTTYDYDLQGHLIEKTNAAGQATTLTYDLLGQLVKATDPAGTSTYYAYDELGEVLESINGSGEHLRYEYDNRGLLLQRQGDGVDDRFYYDALGREVYAENGVTSYTQQYDDLGRSISIENAGLGMVRRVFDADGRVSQLVYPTNPSLGVGSGAGVSYEHDGRNQLIGVKDRDAGEWRFTYDLAGRPVRTQLPSAMQRVLSYRDDGFLDRVDITDASGATVDYYAYSNYDLQGNPQAITTTEGTTSVLYDLRRQVTRVDYPGTDGFETFSYDLLGNRTSHRDRFGNQKTYEYSTAIADLLVAIQDTTTGQTLETFQYDSAGRRRSRWTYGGTVTYAYDVLGRLTQRSAVQNNAGGTTTELDTQLEYDPRGHRYHRAESQTITDPSGSGGPTASWISDAKYFGEWMEVRGNTAVRLIHGNGPRDLLAQLTETGDRYSIVRDGQRNVANVLVNGAIDPSPPRYEAFGSLRNGAAQIERGFAGAPVEGASGLIYMGARHYDPTVGRFLQADPLSLKTSEMYAYASNNPYVNWDPTGLEAGSFNGASAIWDHGFGFGVTLGLDAEAGAGFTGAAANGDVGAMMFVNGSSIQFDDVANGGAFANFMNRSVETSPGPYKAKGHGVLGAFAGGGANLVFTTANSVEEMSSSLTSQLNLNLAWGVRVMSLHIGISESGDITIVYGGPIPGLPVTGLGYGASYSQTPSTTVSPLGGE